LFSARTNFSVSVNISDKWHAMYWLPVAVARRLMKQQQQRHTTHGRQREREPLQLIHQ